MLRKGGIPGGVRLLTWSTSIRWFGWGLGEAFIPIFLLLFSASFLEAGLLAASYNILFFLSIPLAGLLADSIQIKKMILVGLIIYVFIGLGYFLAGVTSAIIFIIIARGLNGISYALDQVGRESYFLRHSSKKKISRIFGYFDFVGNFWWVVAVVIGLFLVKFVSAEIHWLLFFIAPTSILSFLLVLKLKEKKRQKTKSSVWKAYTKTFQDIKQFNTGLKTVLFLSFILGILSSIMYFFVPISSYLEGDGIINAAILALVYALAPLFGKFLGKIADNKREKVYFFSFLLLTLTLVGLIFFKNYFIILFIMLIASMVFELLSLTNKGMIARLADRTHLGETDGSLNGISALGAIIGPIVFGFMIDSIGLSAAYLVIAIVSAFSLIILLKRMKHLKVKIS